ncbi:MAG: ABATE domain-containing protein [Thermodesulfobacteriota bacterium]
MMMVRRRRGPGGFLWLGNQRALDFLNTEVMARGERVDLLQTGADLVAWLAEAGLLSDAALREARERWADSPAGRRLVAEARALRGELRLAVDRIVAGKAVPPSALEAVNALLRERAGWAEVVRAGRRFARRFHFDVSEPRRLLVPLAEAASDLLCEADLARVRRCENPACILYFYDASKNHGRRWCSMSGCGNRMKAAAHYRRTRGLPPAPHE